MEIIPVLSDRDRSPALEDLSLLRKLRQGDSAPVFNFKSGDRLSRDDVERVNDYRDAIRRSPKHWAAGEKPGWLESYLVHCSGTVPAYRNCSNVFEENPTIARRDLHKAPWSYVSDECHPDDLLVYGTSGTTGPPMDVLFDEYITR